MESVTMGGLQSLDSLHRMLNGYRSGRLDLDDPVFLAITPTVIDASRAPAGKHTFKLISFLPYELAEGPQHWDQVKEQVADRLFEALKVGLWDIAFLAIDPVRAAGIDFTAPYVVIEGTYLVPKDSALRTIADVDRDGVRVAVAQGSAYDLYLTRALKHAKLVRQPSGPEALEMFVRDRLEAAGGVRQPIVAFAQAHPDTRVIPGRFMAIEQAMGTVKGRAAGGAYLRKFIEEMKASGFVAQALKTSGQADASVAPPA